MGVKFLKVSDTLKKVWKRNSVSLISAQDGTDASFISDIHGAFFVFRN